MAHVDSRADCALTRVEISPDCIEGGVSMTMIITGGGEHRRQDRVLEPVRKMLGLEEEAEGAEGALGSKEYLPHDLPLKAREERAGPNALGFVIPALLDHDYDH
jgi:hypothetical protein